MPHSENSQEGEAPEGPVLAAWLWAGLLGRRLPSRPSLHSPSKRLAFIEAGLFKWYRRVTQNSTLLDRSSLSQTQPGFHSNLFLNYVYFIIKGKMLAYFLVC